MTNQKESNLNPLWKLGLVITLPWILLSGPLAGFIVGQWICVKYLGMSSLSIAVCMMVGLAGSGFQTWRLIKKLRDTQKNA